MLKYALRYLPLFSLIIALIGFSHFSSDHDKYLFQVDQNPFSNGSALYGVAMVSTNDAWAVGGSFQGTKPVSGSLFHYTASAWSAVDISNKAHAPLLGVAFSTFQDGWTVGYDGICLHYDGASWSSVISPTTKTLRSVVAFAPNNVWAVGNSGTLLHFDGTIWGQVQPELTTSDLYSLAMVDEDEGWAVGDGVILHYFNHRWSLFESPVSTILHSVTMLSHDEGWATGDKGVVLHFRNGVWEQVKSVKNYDKLNNVNFYAIAMQNLHTGFLAGNQHLLIYRGEMWDEPDGPSFKSFLHQTNQDETFLGGSLSLYSIAVDASGEGWAVGRENAFRGSNSNPGSINSPAFLHYHRQQWTNES